MRRGFRMAAVMMAVWMLVYTGAAAEVAPPEETPVVSSAPDATPEPSANLVYGAKGEAVVRLQTRLRELGYLTGEADGIYGKDTRKAVTAFQRRNDLDADGQAGPKTQARLYSDDALPAPEETTVDMLSEELPVLVNRDYPMDEYTVPANLVVLKDALDSKLVKIKYAETMAVEEAVEALERMLKAAKEDGVTKWQISSAYRSWQDQERMLTNKINTLRKQHKWSQARARKAALRTVAEPGCSEHQTGLAIDINVPGAATFQGTKQCKWLHAHCWEYGFIVRYQKGKEEITGFEAEAWHIRYVGEAHAARIHELDMCLEEYLEGIRDGSVTLPGAETDTPEMSIPEIVIPGDEGDDAA